MEVFGEVRKRDYRIDVEKEDKKKISLRTSGSPKSAENQV